MKKKVQEGLFHLISHNLSFKIVSLIISIILWVAVLGRRDFIVTKSLEIDLVLSSRMQVSAQSTDRVKVKVFGPRAAVRKFIEGGYSQFITVDLSQKDVGRHKIILENERIDIPFGAKLLNIQPKEIDVELNLAR